MHSKELLLVTGTEIESMLSGRELEIIETVKKAYIAHKKGHSSLPYSTFLRFEGEEKNRIIALPAYLGDEFNAGGIKWISSFPNNINIGLERASALIVLNSMETGRPVSVMEGSVISATRTAASAALGASYLHKEQPDVLGMIGCGFINFQILRFLLSIYTDLKDIIIYDIDKTRADRFKEICEKKHNSLSICVKDKIEEIFNDASLISMATTSTKPYVNEITSIKQGSTILHISLRDLSKEIILSSQNIVDDIEHVCRAHTSIHLAEMSVGNTNFINCTLSDIAMGDYDIEKCSEKKLKIFSPFGLGILDIALARLVYDEAKNHQIGTAIDSFFPAQWN